ncbi:MAG: proteasome subunit alpha, partial [Actinomycetota bacterium]
AKPLEVEILVAEVGEEPSGDRLFRISFDGTVMDEDGLSVLGGDTETVASRMTSTVHDGTFASVLRAAVSALAGPERTLSADDLEVAVLGRGGRRRRFDRLDVDRVRQMLS